MQVAVEGWVSRASARSLTVTGVRASQHHQGAELRQRDVVDIGQRPSRHSNERSRRLEERIRNRLNLRRLNLYHSN